MPKFQHAPFMIAVDEKDLIVTVTCKPSEDQTQFRKVLYEIAIPKDRGKDLTAEQMFEEAREVFQVAQDDL